MPNGIGIGIEELDANDWQLNDYTYPAAQYGHPATGSAAAITGGYVIDPHH